MKSTQTGFTLVELMIVVLIGSILIGVGLPSYRNYGRRASRADGTMALLKIASSQEKFYLQNGTYASTAQLVVAPPTKPRPAGGAAQRGGQRARQVWGMPGRVGGPGRESFGERRPGVRDGAPDIGLVVGLRDRDDITQRIDAGGQAALGALEDGDQRRDLEAGDGAGGAVVTAADTERPQSQERVAVGASEDSRHDHGPEPGLRGFHEPGKLFRVEPHIARVIAPGEVDVGEDDVALGRSKAKP